ncbi:MAG: MnhB domain-containing protein [Chlamydiales bacterium]
MTPTFFDWILVLALISLAWKILRAKDLFVSIVLFILFGLLSSLAWVELQAPDIALVEASIGAGVIGALFLGVLGRIESSQIKSSDTYPRANFTKRIVLLFLTTVLIAIACRSILTVTENAIGLSQIVFKNLSQSGVQNPVTSVILNFRGYDTLLEIGVLFLVAISIHALHVFQPAILRTELPESSPVLILFLHLLTPVMILLSAFLLWIGAEAPGGAFQAGSILTAVGILLFLGEAQFSLNFRNKWFRLALASGLACFLLSGISVMGNGRFFLQFPEAISKTIILIIELLATISIGLILLTLFAGCAGFLNPNEKRKNT